MSNIRGNEKRLLRLSFIQFIGEFFTNYKQFIKTFLTVGEPPFLFLMIWLLGMSNSISLIERQNWWDHWIAVWAFILIGGAIFGGLRYWIGGSLYHLRVWLSGGKKHFRISRSLFLYTGMPIYLSSFFITLFNTVIYGNAYFKKPTNSFLDVAWGIIGLIAIIYSIILSYRGVRLLLETGFIRTIILFIILPGVLFSVPIAWPIYQELEYKPKWKHFEGGLHLVLDIGSKEKLSMKSEHTFVVKHILTERLQQRGIRKKIIRITGERGIIVQLPKLEDSKRVIELISKPYYLEFKLVDEDNSLDEALKGNIPIGSEILYQVQFNLQTKQEERIPFLVKRKPLLTGEYIAKASVQIDSQYNEPYIQISFNERGKIIFERITGENIDKRLAIVIDKKVYSAPVIREKISGGRAWITGRFTLDEARDLAIALRTGAYPASTKLMVSRELTRDIWLGDER